MDIDNRTDGSGILRRLPPTRRRKKDFSSISMSTSFAENQDCLRDSSVADPSSDTEAMEFRFMGVRSFSSAPKYLMDKSDSRGSRHFGVSRVFLLISLLLLMLCPHLFFSRIKLYFHIR